MSHPYCLHEAMDPSHLRVKADLHAPVTARFPDDIFYLRFSLSMDPTLSLPGGFFRQRPLRLHGPIQIARVNLARAPDPRRSRWRICQ